ncbi:PREDICTED: microfibril-associated glycoprotein 4-like [Branchiostoma belcheri]|uniref:Microfibril-associated glycoprotein 4-like n=1 Tax=Branchiostoma belcheri TaxID=7741 RepID=A0A6P5A7D7_BRABE|nr:PREDICTED: microfibril-associated glycoprotein 4-like [Branchiostoma belcheri]XP_019639196.1 PREDICTED: microfibril-associated glycoprotein 4-like [Branchiostoma belcheri]XP_019639197.1 PREDICTED: microfibril-associated glycoprotein 4-like [Branchiostoma belcheri]
MWLASPFLSLLLLVLGAGGQSTLNQERRCGQYTNERLGDGNCRFTAVIPQDADGKCPNPLQCTEFTNLMNNVTAQEEQAKMLQNRVTDLENVNKDLNLLLETHTDTIAQLQSKLHQVMEVINSMQNHSVVNDAPNKVTDTGPEVPRDCASLYRLGHNTSTVYSVTPQTSPQAVPVYCDMNTSGGGWTVIQRRVNGSTDFQRTANEYKVGFGEVDTEHWLGNAIIHLLTNQGAYKLRIDMEDWEGERRYAEYGQFRVNSENDNFRLLVNGYSGTAGDAFSWYHNYQAFSVPAPGNTCAILSKGGWWYNSCFYANLNGKYYRGGEYGNSGSSIPDGIVWNHEDWRNTDYYSLKFVEMKIRPANF